MAPASLILKADDVQRRQRLAVHRVHVGERVGRRDRAVGERVVDDRREEVDRLHDRPLRIQRDHPRVVGPFHADDQAGVSLVFEQSRRGAPQDLRGQLRRSTRRFHHASEAVQPVPVGHRPPRCPCIDGLRLQRERAAR
jgi:hypothetical protein